MFNSKLIAWLAGGTLLAASSPVLAQRWGREPVPRDGACFYRDANYRGDYFCASAGESFRAVPEDMNDRISSIRIFGRAEVIVYRDVRFDGDSTRFDGNVRNLREEGWNDRVSSLRIRGASSNGFGGRPGRDAGRDGGSFGSSREADRIVRRAYQDLLEREPDAEGLRIYRSHIIDDDWSEARVRDELQRSQEYREKTTMTPAKAAEIVRRAYVSVLRREPDPDSRTYVDKVLRDRWTQQDVERELRQSAEYRNRNR